MPRTTKYPNREEWLIARRQGIGGSDAAAVMGVSPWSNRWVLWAEKRGLLRPDDSQEWQRIGLVLEPAIRQLYELETGRELLVPDAHTIFHSEDVAFQFATLDAQDRSEHIDAGVVELKIVGGTWRDWHKGEVPLYYQIQAQHQMAVAGVTRAAFAVLFGSPSFNFGIFEVPRNDRFIEAMTRLEGDLWEQIESGTPPELDGSEITRRALQRMPSEAGETIELPPEFAEIDRQRQELIDQQKRLAEQQTELDNRIKAAMGSAEIALLEETPIYSWKADKRGTRRLLRVLKGSLDDGES